MTYDLPGVSPVNVHDVVAVLHTFLVFSTRAVNRVAAPVPGAADALHETSTPFAIPTACRPDGIPGAGGARSRTVIEDDAESATYARRAHGSVAIAVGLGEIAFLPTTSNDGRPMADKVLRAPDVAARM